MRGCVNQLEVNDAGIALPGRRGEKIFAGACASCHDWTGVSPVTGFATLTGVRAVNDPSATNVAQTVINGVSRKTAEGRIFMPAFGEGYSDDDIAAVANYVTARFGARGANLTAKDVAALREQAAQQSQRQRGLVWRKYYRRPSERLRLGLSAFQSAPLSEWSYAKNQ